MKNYKTFISFKKEKHKILTLLGLGALSSFAMPPYYILPFLVLGLSILFYCINKSDKWTKNALYGFSFGFGFGAVGMAWLGNALTIDSGTFAWAIPFVWLGMGLLFGIFYALPAVFSTFYPAGMRKLFAFAGWFVLFEWVRSWILTGFPWNLVSAGLSVSLPMVQSAAIWGVYGLSLVTVLTFCTPAFWPKKKPIIIAGLCLVILYLGGLWRLYDASSDQVWGVKLRLVQPNIPQSLKWDATKAEEHYSKLIRLSRENNNDITHVIWPESAIPYYIDHDEAERLRLMSAVRQGGTLISGGLRGENLSQRQIANSIFIIDDLADIKGYYDKFHLVPFGEFMPLRSLIPLDKIVPIPSDFVRGQGLRTIHIPKAPPASLLVCYEIIFSGQVAKKDKRPSWLINVSNNAWYGLTAGPYQYFEMLRMRAIEEGLPVAHASNNGVSGVIDAYGQIVSSLDLGEEGIIDTYLPKAIPATPYAKTGAWPILLFAVILVVFSAKKRK